MTNIAPILGSIGRFALELVLNALGFLNFIPIFSSAKRQKKRIAFEVYSMHLAQMYKTMITELQKQDDQYEIYFIILLHPHFSLKSITTLKKYLRDELQIQNILLYWEVIWKKFDLLICHDAYAKFPLRTTKKLIIKHGPGINFRYLNWHPYRKSFFDFDQVLLNGPLDAQMILKACPKKASSLNVTIVGFPYTDQLFTYNSAAEASYTENLSFGNDKLTVLFAPSWSGLKLMLGNGENYFDQITELLKTLDCNVIIKMHACSFNKIMAGFDWQKKLLSLHNCSNIKIDYDVNDMPAMRLCDVLITDLSSRGLCFMLLDKPVIYYSPGPFRDIQDQHRQDIIKDAFLIPKATGEMKTMLTSIIHGQLTYPDTSAIKQLCFANIGHATQACIDVIEKELRNL